MNGAVQIFIISWRGTRILDHAPLRFKTSIWNGLSAYDKRLCQFYPPHGTYPMSHEKLSVYLTHYLLWTALRLFSAVTFIVLTDGFKCLKDTLEVSPEHNEHLSLDGYPRSFNAYALASSTLPFLIRLMETRISVFRHKFFDTEAEGVNWRCTSEPLIGSENVWDFR